VRFQPDSGSALRRAFLALVAVAAVGMAGSAVPAPESESRASDPIDSIDSLESLMLALAQTDSMRAHYTEQKHLALMREPLESEGVIVFVQPNRFARHTTRPGRASLVIQGDDLVTSDETGEDRMDLSQSDVAQQLVGSLVDVLRGDQTALEANYQVAFEADRGGWSLRLSPRSSQVARFVERIDIRGAAAEVASMTVREPNGDRTVTRFDGFETDLGLSAEELDLLFSAARRTRDE
jgi:outer membrane lipoprotein-sorting protein